MGQTMYCFCGHPITVWEEPDGWGGRYVYSDTKTGRILNECPCCEDSPLERSQLCAEPASGEPMGDKYKEALA